MQFIDFENRMQNMLKNEFHKYFINFVIEVYFW